MMTLALVGRRGEHLIYVWCIIWFTKVQLGPSVSSSNWTVVKCRISSVRLVRCMFANSRTGVLAWHERRIVRRAATVELGYPARANMDGCVL